MNLDSFLGVLYARRWLIGGITLAGLALALLFTLIMPKLYLATTDLIIDGKGQDPLSGQSAPARMMAGYLGTQAEIVRSRNVAGKVVDQLKLMDNQALARELHLKDDAASRRKTLISYLLDNLQVIPKRDSNVMSIAFQARNPELAAKVADAFAQAYIQTNLELRIEPARQITRWYDLQLASLRDTLVEKQNALSAYQEKHNILVSSDRLDLESAKLAELSSMLIAAQGESMNNANRSGSRGLPPGALENPQVQRIYGELSQAQARMDDLATKVGENHPQYRQAQGEVESLNRQLGQALAMISGSLRNSVEMAKNRAEQLEAEVAAQKERVLQLSRNRNDLALLKQEVDNAQASYDAALARASQTRLESQASLTDISILNTAPTPNRPTSPKAKMNLLLGTLAGLLLGIALSLVWEWLDRRVRNKRDLEQDLGLPVLACIPAGIHVSQANRSSTRGRLPFFRKGHFAKEVMA